MLRLACVLLYQGRFKSRRSGGSHISLRVRSILMTFCIYFCRLHIILVLCATLCSFSTYNSLVFAFSQFACVCMFVCVLCIEQGEAFQTCVDTRTCVPAFFCFAVRNYKFFKSCAYILTCTEQIPACGAGAGGGTAARDDGAGCAGLCVGASGSVGAGWCWWGWWWLCW